MVESTGSNLNQSYTPLTTGAKEQLSDKQNSHKPESKSPVLSKLTLKATTKTQAEQSGILKSDTPSISKSEHQNKGLRRLFNPFNRTTENQPSTTHNSPTSNASDALPNLDTESVSVTSGSEHIGLDISSSDDSISTPPASVAQPHPRAGLDNIVNDKQFSQLSQDFGEATWSMLAGTEYFQSAHQTLSDAQFNDVVQAVLTLKEEYPNTNVEDQQFVIDMILSSDIDISKWNNFQSLLHKVFSSIESQIDSNHSDNKIAALLNTINLDDLPQTLDHLASITDDSDAASVDEQSSGPIGRLKQLNSDLDSLTTLLHKENQSELADIIDNLNNHLENFTTHATKKVLHNHLKSQLDFLRNPGTASSTHIKLGLGATFGKLIGLPTADLTFELDLKVQALTNDDLKVKIGASATPSVRLQLGNQLANASAYLGYTFRKAARSTSNFDEFIKVLSDNIVHSSALEIKGGKTRSSIKNSTKSKSTLKKALAANQDLARLLHKQGIIDSRSQIIGQHRPLVAPYLTDKTRGITSGVEASLFGGTLNIPAFYHENTKTEYTQHLELLETFKNHPEIAKEQDPNYFNIQLRDGLLNRFENSNSTHQVLSQLEEQLDNTDSPLDEKTLSELRTDLFAAIVNNKKGFDQYVQNIQNHDIKKTPNSRMEKWSLEKDRGVTNRGDFIRAVISTHTRLYSLYEKCLDQSSSPLSQAKHSFELIHEIERSFQNPQINLKQQHIEKSLTSTLSGTGTNDKYSTGVQVNLSLIPILQNRVSLSVNYNNTVNNINPSLDGKSLVITGEFQQGVGLQQVIGAIGDIELPSDAPSLSDFNWSNFDNSINLSGITTLLLLYQPPLSDELAEKIGLSEEDNKGHWIPQYTRESTRTGINIGVSSAIPTGALDVSFKAGLHTDKYVVNNEKLSSNGLQYLAIYHGGSKARDDNFTDWNQYKENHQHELNLLADNVTIITSSSRAYFEERLHHADTTLKPTQKHAALANASNGLETPFESVDQLRQHVLSNLALNKGKRDFRKTSAKILGAINHVAKHQPELVKTQLAKVGFNSPRQLITAINRTLKKDPIDQQAANSLIDSINQLVTSTDNSLIDEIKSSLPAINIERLVNQSTEQSQFFKEKLNDTRFEHETSITALERFLSLQASDNEHESASRLESKRVKSGRNLSKLIRNHIRSVRSDLSLASSSHSSYTSFGTSYHSSI